jgi:hypothetical protein
MRGWEILSIDKGDGTIWDTDRNGDGRGQEGLDTDIKEGGCGWDGAGHEREDSRRLQDSPGMWKI